MWPLRMPARGSGTAPVKRPAARASSTSSRRVCDIAEHVADAAQARRPVIGTKGRGPGAARVAGLDRPALPHPFRQAAIQHGRLVVAEQAHQPPAARGRSQTLLVVEHDARVVADAQGAEQLGEPPRRGNHVRQVRIGVGDLIDVEIAGAGNVRGAEGVRLVPGSFGRYLVAVEDDQVGLPSSPASQSVETRFPSRSPPCRPHDAARHHGASSTLRATPVRRCAYWPAVTDAVAPSPGHAASTTYTRRFCLPLFSILLTSTRPISPVRRTWVPPQGCRSTGAASRRCAPGGSARHRAAAARTACARGRDWCRARPRRSSSRRSRGPRRSAR